MLFYTLCAFFNLYMTLSLQGHPRTVYRSRSKTIVNLWFSGQPLSLIGILLLCSRGFRKIFSEIIIPLLIVIVNLRYQKNQLRKIYRFVCLKMLRQNV